ncbi:TIM barrel protein [Candidatus Halocynthiibacter alkanivorans]|uniref:TIM barrel protein n=1 Tax=Candidatus Halocynthiibacter alkanivorans TaxID=2267619 RepID=UPI000DF47F08|nr:TIM barrel protein [Candidatus Halocynthiibacter alkanivorans]
MAKKLSFALNHMTVATKRYDEVIAIASHLGCVGVEFRNDLPRALFDGDAPGAVKALAAESGVRILGLSEVKMFNDLSPERAVEARALMKIARELGAESISLIPRCDGEGCGNGERQANLRIALRQIVPMLQEFGLTGLVEPLGFEHSSLRYKHEAMDVIDGLNARGTLKLVHDTFHHHLASETEFFAGDTGIVHVSGVADPTVDVRDMQDNHRILVDASDRLGNVAQIRTLLADGYTGAVSYEAFSPLVHEYTDPIGQVSASMTYVCDQLAAAGIEAK